jgi:hypothetical protein
MHLSVVRFEARMRHSSATEVLQQNDLDILNEQKCRTVQNFRLLIQACVATDG